MMDVLYKIIFMCLLARLTLLCVKSWDPLPDRRAAGVAQHLHSPPRPWRK